MGFKADQTKENHFLNLLAFSRLNLYGEQLNRRSFETNMLLFTQFQPADKYVYWVAGSGI